jgi:hypothetical protein
MLCLDILCHRKWRFKVKARISVCGFVSTPTMPISEAKLAFLIGDAHWNQQNGDQTSQTGRLTSLARRNPWPACHKRSYRDRSRESQEALTYLSQRTDSNELLRIARTTKETQIIKIAGIYSMVSKSCFACCVATMGHCRCRCARRQGHVLNQATDEKERE